MLEISQFQTPVLDGRMTTAVMANTNGALLMNPIQAILTYLSIFLTGSLTLIGTNGELTFCVTERCDPFPTSSLEDFARFLRLCKPTPTPSQLEGKLMASGNPADLNTLAWAIIDVAVAQGFEIKSDFERGDEFRRDEFRTIKLEGNTLKFFAPPL